MYISVACVVSLDSMYMICIAQLDFACLCYMCPPPSNLFTLCVITGHRCRARGCGETLVIDGNMKNHRDVCFATEAGFVEYLGLPGRVTTGCSNTPDFKSRYCGLHNPIATQATSETSDQHMAPNQVGLILSK